MKTLFAWALISLGFVGYTQTPEGQIVKRNSGFEKLTFGVKLNKTDYLPLEPIFVKFSVSNLTDTPIAADRPQFLIDSILRVTTPAGEKKEVRRLTTSSSRALSLPGPVPILQPHGAYGEETVPSIDLRLFSKPGNYQIQFVLYGGRTKPLESNVAAITFVPPQGIDKEAFDFLRKHGNDPWFGAVFLEKKSADILKRFVDQFGESSYGEYAVQSLGRYYSYVGEFEKAKAEFQKLETSKNDFLARQSRKDLLENAKREARQKEQVQSPK